MHESLVLIKEIHAALLEMPSHKAPGPDGFNALFFKACWGIIKSDVRLAFQQLHNANRSSMSCVNSSHIVLIPKNDNPASLADYRPISLMHGVAKLFMKVFVVRLAKRIAELVGEGQSAFIRGRSIQDNFLYVQRIIWHFHRARSPLVFLKLDIARAFDSVSWPYPLSMLRARSFSARWCDWVAMMLATSSSRVILNGVVGPRFLHRHGVRQGDPLSPLLFILAIEPLHRLFDLATEAGLLSPLHGRKARLRCFLYAVDAAVFLNLVRFEMAHVHAILQSFGAASGLHVNLAKSTVYGICYQDLDLADIVSPLQASTGSFPCRYLGLPLSFRRPRQIDFQPLIDKLGSRLARWKLHLLSYAGRVILGH
ncbi:hypothetical protein ACQ4PT_011243 [Festuca glaucescens]